MEVLNAIKSLCPAEYENVLRKRKCFHKYCKSVYDSNIPKNKRSRKYTKENIALIHHVFKHDSFLLTFCLSKQENVQFWMEIDEKIALSRNNFC